MPTDVTAHLSEVALTEDGATLRAVLRVPAAHPALAGHFPGAPIVPGVLLVDAVRGACERAFAQSFSIVEVVEVRFFRPVAPDEAVMLSAQLQRAEGARSVDAEWQGASGRCAVVRVRLAPVP